MMKTLLVFAVAALPLSALAGDESAYTPKPGSKERKAICDAMRAYTRTQYKVDPKLHFLWKIDWLRLQGRHASFSGFPVNKDGGYLDDDSMIGDFETNVCLRKEDAGWKVIMDLSRSDVPSEEEIRELRDAVPAGFPTTILPEYWRGKLAPVKGPPPAGSAYTPKPGSPERKAICDAMRAYVRKQYGASPKLQFLWKIDRLRVLGAHASFEGYAVNSSGEYLEDDSMIGDMEATCFLRRGQAGWQVITDLTRGDVPNEEELRGIRASFPKEIPTAIMPQFWRDKLR